MAGTISPLAGKPATAAMLVDVARLTEAYYARKPDPGIAAQRVSFGTSGHRGSAFDNSFNEAHILAISQAICLYRRSKGIDGPMFIGIDTHALSVPALASALEVFAANRVETMIDESDGFTPTPVISHAILAYTRGRDRGFADGVVVDVGGAASRWLSRVHLYAIGAEVDLHELSVRPCLDLPA